MAKGMRSNNDLENRATLSIKATLWAAADKLRHRMDAAEYKHVALGLMFLKYIERKSTQKTLR
jgi:type I restriction enzyme M protein